MVRTFTGLNSFALKQALKEVKTEFIDEYGELAVEIIDGEEADFSQVMAAVESVPFLAAKKLVIINNLGSIRDISEKIEQLIKSANETTELIIIEPKPDKRSSYYKFLKSDTDLMEFKELDERSLANWLAAEAEKLDAQLSFGDAYYLVQRLGSNQQKVYNELRKLIDYDVKISKKNIDLLTQASPQTTIFNLLDTAFSGDKKKILAIYDEQRTQGVEPLNILGMMIWQMHLVALVSATGNRTDAEVMQQSGLKPFTLNKARAIAKRMGQQKIKQTLGKLVELDKQLKTTSADSDEVVKNFLISLS